MNINEEYPWIIVKFLLFIFKFINPVITVVKKLKYVMNCKVFMYFIKIMVRIKTKIKKLSQ